MHELLCCPLISSDTALCQSRLVRLTRHLPNFLQIQTQGIRGVQVGDIHGLFGDLRLLPQPQGRLTGILLRRQPRHIQQQLPIVQRRERILHGLLRRLFQQSQEMGRGNFIPGLLPGQKQLPGAVTKGEIQSVHSKKSSNPMLAPMAWSLSMACFSTWRTRSLEMPSF